MHAVGRKTIRDLIVEEVKTRPRSGNGQHVNLAERLWLEMQRKYPEVHFAWGYFLRTVKEVVNG